MSFVQTELPRGENDPLAFLTQNCFTIHVFHENISISFYFILIFYDNSTGVAVTQITGHLIT